MPPQGNGEAAMKKCSATCVAVSERIGEQEALTENSGRGLREQARVSSKWDTVGRIWTVGPSPS